MAKAHRMRGIAAMAAGIAFLFVFSAFLTGCSRSTGACNEDKTIDALTEAVYASLKDQLSFIAGVTPGSEMSEDEWKLIRVSTQVKVDNIRQTGQQGGRFECAADVVVLTSGGKDEMAVTYASGLTASGDVKVMIKSDE